MPNAFSSVVTPLAAAQLGDYKTLAVTSTSANYNFKGDPGAFQACTIYNTGAKDAYVAFGTTNALVATTGSIPVRSGKSVTLNLNGNAWIAAICGGADTTSLDIYQADASVIPV